MTKTDERPVRREISLLLEDTMKRIEDLFLKSDFTVWEKGKFSGLGLGETPTGKIKFRRILMAYTQKVENLTTEKEENRVYYNSQNSPISLVQKKETYLGEVTLRCSNCDYHIKNVKGDIPKGVTMADFFTVETDKICPDCGCMYTLYVSSYNPL